jgi:NADH-quinone oxidoreductase subunit F
MDLHIHGPEPTADERAAVDAVLGPPVSAWVGGTRDLQSEGHSAEFGGHAARSRRDLLLPVLHAVQNRFGWIPPGAMNYICLRLTVPPAEAHGVATFYHLYAVTERPPAVVHVCDDIACRIRGGEQLCAELEAKYGCDANAPWRRSPCLGQCERAPASLILAAGETPQAGAFVAHTIAVVEAALANPGAAEDTSREALRRSVPQSGAPGLRLIQRIGNVNPASLDEYRATGGYDALRKAVTLGSEGVIREVTASKLMGRGGAAFPTGRKWDAVAQAPARPHYIVCNADESEPGTFKDRLLMEGDPFALVEGMTIAGFATKSEKGYLYIRGEYPLAASRMQHAIDAARAAGLLGTNILGAGFTFDIEIRRGAGAYICGEETALFNSIEGKRGEPRNKPPFPVHVGLFGKPTAINNVETLVNVPLIIREGGETFAGIGTSGSTGPKLFCVSGHVTRPGLYETPFGLTLRQVLELAGGVRDGKRIRAILLGGAAGVFVGPDKLDMPLTFEGTRAAGATLGSGVIMVFDESTDLADILSRIAGFFRDESCGQCVPCRVGTVRQEELLHRLRANAPIGSYEDELALFKEIAQVMRDASICGLGQTAANAIESALITLNPLPQKGQRS